jgi:hypothetical protein
MSELDETLADSVAELNDLIKFEIDKTHQALFEAGKSLGTSFLTYLSVLCLTALLVFGTTVEEGVSVPLLGLKVTRDLAAALSLLLCYVVAIWMISLQVLTASLTTRLSTLLEIRYKRSTLDSWYLQYPSPLHSIRYLIDSIPGKYSNVIGWIIYFGYSGVSAFLPLYLSFRIGRSPNFPVSWKATWMYTTTFLNFSVMIATSVAVGAVLRQNRQRD